MRALFASIALLCIPAACRADSITVGSSGSLECVVLQEDPSHVTVLYQSSVLRINRNSVRSIKKDDANPSPADLKSKATARLPSFETTLVALARQEWANGLRQIPATVIDVGVLRSVPYKSIRCATSYELNFYGDPHEPAGFEIGIHKDLLDDAQAKRNCLNFVGNLLSEPDRAVLLAMQLDQDSIIRGGLTFEITPPTADDAYGGWWVSIFDEKKLDSLRASEQEIEAITVANRPASTKQTVEATTARSPSASSKEQNETQRLNEWTAEELRQARTPRISSSASTSSTSSGRVYVRGYYRKDGTYVQPHTRSAPRR